MHKPKRPQFIDITFVTSSINFSQSNGFNFKSTIFSSRYKHKLVALVCFFFVVPLSGLPAGEVQLSITAANGLWEAFAEITNATSVEAAHIGNCGVDGIDCPITSISAFEINIAGSDGLTVTSSLNESPQYNQAGFSMLRVDNNGTPGLGIAAAQPTILGMPTLILEGIGLVPQNTVNPVWDFPVKLASGTYSGTIGTLTVRDVDPVAGMNGINLTYSLNGVESAAVVSWGTATIPEPSTGGMLLMGCLLSGWAAKRRRFCKT